MTDWRIETASADDIPLMLPLVLEVQTLHAAAYPGRFVADPDQARLAQFFQQTLSDGGTLLLARDNGGAVLGYLLWTGHERIENAFRHADREGMLDHICVASTGRRQGVGKALIAEMKQQMQTQGLSRWIVTYWDFNAASAALMADAGATPRHFRAEGSLT